MCWELMEEESSDWQTTCYQAALLNPNSSVVFKRHKDQDQYLISLRAKDKEPYDLQVYEETDMFSGELMPAKRNADNLWKKVTEIVKTE
jgi:hypothetical protein